MIAWGLWLLRIILSVRMRQFERSLRSPEKAQNGVLKKIHRDWIRINPEQNGGLSPEQFLETQPVTNYDQLEKNILEQMETGRSILTGQKILFYEKTSGSSGPHKYIPYTAALKGSFSRMFALWFYDLLRHGPKLVAGQFYMSVSASSQDEKTAQGIQVGLKDDSQYLDRFWSRLLRPFWVEPALHVETEKMGLHETALALLRAHRLEAISIWNPSFLLLHLDYIKNHRTDLLDALDTSPKSTSNFNPFFKSTKIKRRQAHLRAAFAQDKFDWPQIWPCLRLISCWDAAHAADGAEKLRRLFPNAMVQGKGLLATEAPMTIPFCHLDHQGKGKVPLVDEIVFEFEDETGQIIRLQDVQQDHIYSLIISQQSGLIRYKMGDRVRVNGRVFKTPLLDFIGKEENCSDLVGEKLNADFVGAVIDQLGLDAGYLAVVPQKGETPHYLVLLATSPGNLAELEERFDTSLRASHHYNLARTQLQLGKAKILVHPQAEKIIIENWIKTGRKWGDLKATLLYPALAETDLQQQIERGSYAH
jgi:hypothetical protein